MKTFIWHFICQNKDTINCFIIKNKAIKYTSICEQTVKSSRENVCHCQFIHFLKSIYSITRSINITFIPKLFVNIKKIWKLTFCDLVFFLSIWSNTFHIYNTIQVHLSYIRPSAQNTIICSNIAMYVISLIY